MKRVLLAAGLALALGATPGAAQTRINVAIGVGAPHPFVSGIVVVGRPYFVHPPHRYFHYRYYRYPVFVVRREDFYRHRHHRGRHWD